MTTISTPAVQACAKTSVDLQNLRINHTRIKTLNEELMSLIYPGSQSNILLVVGPTGVGKSTLCKYLVEAQLAQSKAAMDAAANIIPAVYIQAPVSGESEFSWRLFYERILEQLEGNPFGLSKQFCDIDPSTGMLHKPMRQGRSTLAGLRVAVERALKLRSTRFLVIDEAAHIIRQTSKNNMCVQLDTIKSLANECGVQIVLVGSYDLYNLVSLSAQLARRTHVLHFERYRQDRPEDIHAFSMCLRHFEMQMPALWGGQLTPHVESLMENTVGCIGTLSSVLIRAARDAEKKGVWSEKSLNFAYLTKAQVQQILQEVYEGESAIDPSLERFTPSILRKHV